MSESGNEFAEQADRLQAEIDKWKGFPDLIEIPLEMGPSAANRLVRALRLAAAHPNITPSAKTD